MKNAIIVLIGIVIALLIVGGAVALNTMGSNDNQQSDDADSAVEEETDTVKNATLVDDDTSSDSDSDIVSEEVKFNYQNGSGYYREVTYRDGGFRQFDTESNEFINNLPRGVCSTLANFLVSDVPSSAMYVSE